MTASPETEAATPPPLGRQKAFDASFFILTGIACTAALAVAWAKGPMRVVEIAASYLGFLALLTPKILCGFLIAAAVPILIPRETFERWLGRRSGTRGLLIATAAGALVPGGPSMIFPLAASFRLAGASMATLVTFVTAWSLLGINRTVIWEMSFLHIDFVLLRVLICMPLPVLAGLIVQKVLR